MKTLITLLVTLISFFSYGQNDLIFNAVSKDSVKPYLTLGKAFSDSNIEWVSRSLVSHGIDVVTINLPKFVNAIIDKVDSNSSTAHIVLDTAALIKEGWQLPKNYRAEITFRKENDCVADGLFWPLSGTQMPDDTLGSFDVRPIKFTIDSTLDSLYSIEKFYSAQYIAYIEMKNKFHERKDKKNELRSEVRANDAFSNFQETSKRIDLYIKNNKN